MPASAILAGLLSCVALPALAAGETVRSEFAVSLYGLTLAKTNFVSRIDSRSFDISGSVSSAGIASIFDDTKGTTSVRGRFGANAPSPEVYSVNYVSGSKKKSTRIAFAGGRVVKTENTPPVNTARADWVPVKPAHLAGALDPISATLVKAKSPDAVCRRTVRFYDGEMRADLRLSPAGTGRITVPGFDGETVRCTARFVPVSGYRKGHRSIEYLVNSSRIEIAFAPVGDTGVYAPLDASISTKIGTIRVAARRFETTR